LFSTLASVSIQNDEDRRVEEIDIWRTAKQFIDQYGLHAEFRAMTRSSELKAAGDDAGSKIWGRIYYAVEELRRTYLKDGERQH